MEYSRIKPELKEYTPPYFVINYDVRETTREEIADLWAGDIVDEGFAEEHKYAFTPIKIPFSQWNYNGIVSTIMNTLYPSDKVQALTANYNEARDDEELSEAKRKEYMDEYHAYQDKRKEIKALAKEIITNQLNIQ
jgi:hypothetical protein